LTQQVAHYRIVREIARGGMGVVHEAHDERLRRHVALKTIRQDQLDDTARKRFWREARTAAAINHPNVCQVFDVGEHEGSLFLAMELLDGQSLDARLAAGPLSVSETIDVALGALAALEALHTKGLVHRDVKPSNLFLTPHGVKLLDFGLTTNAWAGSMTATHAGIAEPLTVPGVLVGTPFYMAPEQARGETPTPATDLFALGAMLFEMLTGKRAFERASLPEVLRAIETVNPPALTGSPALVAVDRVLHVALAKRPSDRYPSAAAMARALEPARQLAAASSSSQATPNVREIRRLIVLPFRPLRTDAESDFLTLSLPDAITHSLSGLESLVVRSSLVGAKYVTEMPDVQRVAAEMDVDLVLTGTLLRAGDQLQVSAQLFETPSGTLVKSHVARVAWGDVFELQSELARQVVDALAVPLTPRERQNLGGDTPASPAAYELYLRANEAAYRPDRIPEAIRLYEECLQADPAFAPAMARLARCYRFQGKYEERSEEPLARAESLLRKALALNPELGFAHGILAQIETDRGRAQEAMVRLIGQLDAAPHSPDVYAALVYACRFCGLVDASVAAHFQAHRFSSRVPTSVGQTYFVMGSYDRCIESSQDDLGYIGALALFSLGRENEATALLAEREHWRQPPLGLRFLQALHALIEGRADDCVRLSDEARAHHRLGGEELFYLARHYAWVNHTDRAIETLGLAIDLGYFNHPCLVQDPWFASLRALPAFTAVLDRAARRHQAARAAFVDAGGSRYLN
jgi:non-specific serine/threonine protein kinase